MSNSLLRPIWRPLFNVNWQLGLGLILLFGIPRFILVLQASQTGDFSLVSMIFILMWLAPFILLTRAGRRSIGLRKPRHYRWLGYGVLLGMLACVMMYFIATFLFAHSIENWLVYTRQSYQLQTGPVAPSDRWIYFIIFSVIAMTFSPVGEELLYRGLIHRSFAYDLGEWKASVIDSAAFSLTHLAHFGVVYYAGGWKFLPFPALLWVISIFGTGILFSICKERSDSLAGAVVCHAAFNLAMTYLIFYHLY